MLADTYTRAIVDRITRGSMLATFILCWLAPIHAHTQSASQHDQAKPTPASQKTAQEVLQLVNEYCAGCHAVPRPDVLPKRSWPAVIRTMVEISQERRGRAFISKEQMNDIIAFYYGSSPEELPMLPHIEDDASRQFARTDIGASSQLPYITNIHAVPVKKSTGVELLVSDGEARKLLSFKRTRKQWTESALADIEIPVHTQVIDFDDDGDLDILVADLGQFPPLDALAGKLYLLRQTSPGKFKRELLQDKLGRVSDARAVDIDADGDLDIAIAVFGGGNVGEVFWLEHVSDAQGRVEYRKHPLLDVSGTIAVSPADLNGDGKLDVVTLIAQEHEMIVAHVNQGEGKFVQSILARAPHPMYGSTSLSIVDLDQDGDVDILFTNGDAFDAQTDPKPYHGVQWLENTGDMQFVFHSVGRLYGASTAAAGDLDGDGDLDIVAASWVNFWTDARRASLVWYENDGSQHFKPRSIATRPAGLTSIQLVDVTEDGVVDIVAGAIRMDLLLAKLGSNYRASRLFPPSEAGATHPRVIVFENQIKQQPREGASAN